MKKNNAFRRAAALMAALSITVSLAAPAFADTYYIDYGVLPSPKMRMAARPSNRAEINGRTRPGRRPSSPPLIRSSPRWRATWKAPQQRIPTLALW